MESITRIIDNNFIGLLNHNSTSYKQLYNYLSTLIASDVYNFENNSIFISSENEYDALENATSIMHCLIDLKIIEDYSYSYSTNKPCIINIYNHDITWYDIKNYIENCKLIIVCGNNPTITNLKNHSNNEFNNIFSLIFHTIDCTMNDIVNGIKYYLNSLNQYKYIIDNTLFEELSAYISTTYEISNLKNKSYLLDLINNLKETSTIVNNRNLLTSNNLRFYPKRQNTNDIINNIKRTFCYSSCIDDFINYANIANEIQKLSLLNEPANFDAIIKSSNFDNIKTFAKLYADLLHSSSFSILPSNNVRFIEVNQLLRNSIDIENSHGLFVIIQPDNILTIEELTKINNIILNYKKVYHNRIVWLLAALSLDEYAKNNIRTISSNLYKIFDLDEKNELSIKLFYDNYTENKHIKIDIKEYPRIYNSLSLSHNAKEAEVFFDRIVTYYINHEKDKIILNYSKIPNPHKAINLYHLKRRNKQKYTPKPKVIIKRR